MEEDYQTSFLYLQAPSTSEGWSSPPSMLLAPSLQWAVKTLILCKGGLKYIMQLIHSAYMNWMGAHLLHLEAQCTLRISKAGISCMHMRFLTAEALLLQDLTK